MRFWAGRCAWWTTRRRSDAPDPAGAAAALGIPFTCWDLRAEFERLVVSPFTAAYAAGRTPNPCALCNARVKFGLLLDKARELGADALATGHYAGIASEPGGAPRLVRGADRRKDQSYFLFAVARAALPLVRFPLGGLTKDGVRAMARERGLAAAERAESQEICFVPGDDYAGFLARRSPAGAFVPGPIVDTCGAAARRAPRPGALHGGAAARPRFRGGAPALRGGARCRPATNSSSGRTPTSGGATWSPPA